MVLASCGGHCPILCHMVPTATPGGVLVSHCRYGNWYTKRLSDWVGTSGSVLDARSLLCVLTIAAAFLEVTVLGLSEGDLSSENVLTEKSFSQPKRQLPLGTVTHAQLEK